MLKEALQYILDGMRPETQDLCGRAYVITPSGAQEVIETPIVPATLQLHSLDSIVKMIRTEANHIRQQAREQAPTYYAIGKILSLRPLKIRADGLDLDRDDLRVPESMYSNFIQEKPVEGRGVRTRLPMKEFVCKCALSIGVATRPEEYVYGATILQVDDEVLLMRSSDGQTYYLLERMVELP